MAKRVLVNEDSLKDIAAAIKEKIGNEEASFTPGEMGEAIRGIEAGGGSAEANLGELIAEANGGYFAEDFGYDGFHTVYVEVEGEAPEASLGDIIITENGTYYATDEGYDGFLTVEVDVPSGGGDLPEEALNITGNCSYRFARNGWNWFIKEYGDKVITKDITTAANMFAECQEGSGVVVPERIPFSINLADKFIGSLNEVFKTCHIKELPEINIATPIPAPTSSYSGWVSYESMFSNAMYIREIPTDYITKLFAPEYWEARKTYAKNGEDGLFQGCSSLRKYCDLEPYICYNPTASQYYSIYNALFNYCYVLDEAVNLPVETFTDYT